LLHYYIAQSVDNTFGNNSTKMVVEGNKVLEIFVADAAAAAARTWFFHYRGTLRPVSAQHMVKHKYHTA
jgi:hypothetical protein